MRIFNCWRKANDCRTFSLFNVWYSPDFFGVTILNFGIEFSRFYKQTAVSDAR